MAADISTALKNWSTTESSNSPSGSTAISTNLDDNIRMLQTVVRQDLAHKGSDIASASTTDLGAVAGSFHDITGSTTVTGLGTVSAGIHKWVKYEGAIPLVHNSTSLILLGGANRTVASGDTSLFISEGSGNWRELAYFKVSGLPIIGDLPDSLLRVVGSSDSTKKLAFEVDGFTTATTRTVTFPDANLTIPAVTAKGDLVAASGSGVLVRVAVSATNGDELIADSTASGGVSYRTKLTIATEQATTSGTSIDFTSIPSWVKRITVMLEGVSTNGTSRVVLRIGDSGGIESTTYDASAVALVNSAAVATGADTSSFPLIGAAGVSGNALNGQVVLTLKDSTNNTWTASGVINNGGDIHVSAGVKSTSGTLDRVRLTTINGTDTFDAGSINIMYE